MATEETLTIIPLSVVEAEIHTLQNKREEAGRAQETLENELVEMRQQLELVSMEIELAPKPDPKNVQKKRELESAIANLDSQFNSYKQGCTTFSKALSILGSYRDAIKCIKRGLPKNILHV